jgi:hypothetical protein
MFCVRSYLSILDKISYDSELRSTVFGGRESSYGPYPSKITHTLHEIQIDGHYFFPNDSSFTRGTLRKRELIEI